MRDLTDHIDGSVNVVFACFYGRAGKFENLMCKPAEMWYISIFIEAVVLQPKRFLALV